MSGKSDFMHFWGKLIFYSKWRKQDVFGSENEIMHTTIIMTKAPVFWQF